MRRRDSTQQGIFTVADQFVSGASNFVLAIAVARSSSLDGFGAFALFFAVYVIALTASRAILGQPLLLNTDHPVDTRNALRATIVLGTFIALPAAVTALVLGNYVGLCVALGLPILLIQDNLRYLCFVLRRAQVALAADAFWLAAVSVSLFFGIRTVGSVPVPLLAWLAGGLLSALGLLRVLMRCLVSEQRQSFGSWVLVQRQLGQALLFDMAVTLVVSQSSVFLLAMTAGLDSLGRFRIAQTVFAPLSNVFSAYGVAGLPLARRAVARGSLSATVVVALPLLGITFAFSLVALGLPDSVGMRLLGSNWLEAQPLLWPFAAAQALLAVSLTIGLIFRVRRDVRSIVAVRIQTALPEPTLVPLAALASPIAGPAWGFMIAQVFTVVVACAWWRKTRHPVAAAPII